MTRCGRDAVDHRAFEESRMHRVATHLGAEPRPVQRHRLGEQADAGVGSNAVAALPSGEQATRVPPDLSSADGLGPLENIKQPAQHGRFQDSLEAYACQSDAIRNWVWLFCTSARQPAL